jgi:hypothetical protein
MVQPHHVTRPWRHPDNRSLESPAHGREAIGRFWPNSSPPRDRQRPLAKPLARRRLGEDAAITERPIGPDCAVDGRPAGETSLQRGSGEYSGISAASQVSAHARAVTNAKAQIFIQFTLRGRSPAASTRRAAMMPLGLQSNSTYTFLHNCRRPQFARAPPEVTVRAAGRNVRYGSEADTGSPPENGRSPWMRAASVPQRSHYETCGSWPRRPLPLRAEEVEVGLAHDACVLHGVCERLGHREGLRLRKVSHFARDQNVVRVIGG